MVYGYNRLAFLVRFLLGFLLGFLVFRFLGGVDSLSKLHAYATVTNFLF